MIEIPELIEAVELCVKGCNGEGCIFNEEPNANGGLSGKRCVDFLAEEVVARLRERQVVKVHPLFETPFKSNWIKYSRCPNCGRGIDNKTNEVACGRCGQAVVWGD